MGQAGRGAADTFLADIRVLEIADELGEYCGKVLAGLGAEVIKVEPLGGEKTRRLGPFYKDEPHPDRSLYFWHYNYGKRSVVLDLDSVDGQAAFRKLAASVDVVIDTRPRSYLADRGLGYAELRKINPSLVYARITPFGDEGPWGEFLGSDLIHLALGGMMMNCGYDADPFGNYDTPPVAPQMWHAYHITGEVTAIQILAALNHRLETGAGQQISASVHDAVSKNTEADLPDWVYAKQPHYRQTCKHSFAKDPNARIDSRVPGIARTKDGRWLYPYRTYLPGVVSNFAGTVEMLKKWGAVDDLDDPKYLEPGYAGRPEVSAHIGNVIDAAVVKYLYKADLWRDAQDQGLPWAPVRRPEENLTDAHWLARSTFAEVEYPELGKSFMQVHAKWESPDVPWPKLRRAPLLGEDSAQVMAEAATARPSQARTIRPCPASPTISQHGKPYALAGLKVLDLGWMLASGGAGRFFTAHGANVVKVEHKSRPDGYRMGGGQPPPGGRSERDASDKPFFLQPNQGLNRSGSFMEINAGKKSLSLNLKHPEGRAILEDMIRQADIIVEGFSPGAMDRMGLGYPKLKELNPSIVYIQQSGMGQIGTYGSLRSYGPTAQAFSGLSDMSGLPEPYPPAGIGYSYLDWFGAYQMALGMMAGLYRQRRIGKGCWVDSSQVEVGIFLTGAAVLDYTVNGRTWSRYGNRSPYMPAAPHGAYRARGKDSWVAMGAFDDAQWLSVVRVLDRPAWGADPRFSTLADRMANQDALDELVNEATTAWEPYALMNALQAAGVHAGVCQTAEDRCENDPQLKHLGWQRELPQTELGTWPVKELTGLLSETPNYVGGLLDRSGPNYGEDCALVLSEWLGLTPEKVAELEAEGAL